MVRGRWRSDVGSVEFDSSLRPAVLRSVRALRLLSVSSSSDTCILRALTTSLPARTGNERNIDERFAWLRDSAQAIRVFSRLQRMDWAGEHRQWLHRTRSRHPSTLPRVSTVGRAPRFRRRNHPPGLGRQQPRSHRLACLAPCSILELWRSCPWNSTIATRGSDLKNSATGWPIMQRHPTLAVGTREPDLADMSIRHLPCGRR